MAQHFQHRISSTLLMRILSVRRFSVLRREEDGTLKEYHAINHSMMSGANNQEWNTIIMRLYELGYSNAQLPSRYELDNYHDYMDGITINEGRI